MGSTHPTMPFRLVDVSETRQRRSELQWQMQRFKSWLGHLQAP